MTGVPKLLRKRWVLISGSLLLLLLIVAGGWYWRFARPCRPDDLCPGEPTADADNPFVGVYEMDPLDYQTFGWPSRRVVLHADGTFCRTVGGDHAEEGNWTIDWEPRGVPLWEQDAWLRWDIEFTVFRACGAGPGARRAWTDVMNISAVVAPDGSMRNIVMHVWWGLGPSTGLKKIR